MKDVFEKRKTRRDWTSRDLGRTRFAHLFLGARKFLGRGDSVDYPSDLDPAPTLRADSGRSHRRGQTKGATPHPISGPV